MATRVEYEETDAVGEPMAVKREAPHEPAGANKLRLRASAPVKRGRGVFRYDRGVIAAAVGLTRAAIYTAERRGELRVGNLGSVARFIVRRLDRADRRRAR